MKTSVMAKFNLKCLKPLYSFVCKLFFRIFDSLFFFFFIDGFDLIFINSDSFWLSFIHSFSILLWILSSFFMFFLIIYGHNLYFKIKILGCSFFPLNLSFWLGPWSESFYSEESKNTSLNHKNQTCECKWNDLRSVSLASSRSNINC